MSTGPTPDATTPYGLNPPGVGILMHEPISGGQNSEPSSPLGSFLFTGSPITYAYRLKLLGFAEFMLPLYGSTDKKLPSVLE